MATTAMLGVSGQPALAWGPEGHAIIAEIAQRHLTPTAKVEVAQLLGQEGLRDLDQVASWADDYRHSHRKTGPWHYVNIPLNAAGYDRARDCPIGNCVVQKIQDFSAVLADKTAEPAARLEALKFVVHFVGDIHQPLHCEDNGDRGGNDVHLEFAGRSTNLHAVWDSGIIEGRLSSRHGRAHQANLVATNREADMLNARIGAADAASWSPPGDVAAAAVQWANESHALAPGAYKNVPDPDIVGLDAAYEAAEWPVIEVQLQKAGVRLAVVLNQDLK